MTIKKISVTKRTLNEGPEHHFSLLLLHLADDGSGREWSTEHDLFTTGSFTDPLRRSDGDRVVTIHPGEFYRRIVAEFAVACCGCSACRLARKMQWGDILNPLNPEAPISQADKGAVALIRAEISRLEGELTRLSGKPLIIYDQGGSYYENCDIPSGGALLTYSPAISEYGYQEWYPTLEAAKAALLKMGRENNTMPDATGLNLDLTPEAAQYGTCAYITRR